jgi:uncharacterized protein (DUF885 family)
MKRYILIIITLVFVMHTSFAQQKTKPDIKKIEEQIKAKSQQTTTPTKKKDVDSNLLKKMREQSELLKSEKEKYGVKLSDADKKFNMYKTMFLNRFWQFNTDWATMSGYHLYDSILIVPTEMQRETEYKFLSEELTKIKKAKYDSLSDLNKIDYKIIENELNKQIWYLLEYRSYEWNPATYNVGGAFSYILSEDYSPLNKRLQQFNARLDKVPAYYEAAKQNIKNPTKEYLDLAIEQNEAIISTFEKDYIDSLKSIGISGSMLDAYKKKSTAAVTAIRSYIQFLKDFKNDNPRSFRLGSTLYAKKFDYEIQSQYTIDEILAAAQKRKEYLLTQMESLSQDLWYKYYGKKSTPPSNRLELIKKVIDIISEQHVKPADFKSEIEKQLPTLAAFVKSKNLVFLDPTKPLKVRNEPGYMAGVAGASMSSPGPYEKKGTAYYNVGTLDGWQPEKAESYLREYNNYVLQILNIHEAIPGHYVQLMYSNKSPSLIKSVFGNDAMIEGWAVYSELMMLENGYGNNAQEMWLMYYKWNLRSVCNTILDISVHTKNMSKDDAMNLLVNQAFQQQAEAEGKWHRVQVSNVQLDSYFTGFYEITNLREEYKKKLGSTYTVKKFNEQLLSYGSAPVKYIKEMMLKK